MSEENKQETEKTETNLDTESAPGSKNTQALGDSPPQPKSTQALDDSPPQPKDTQTLNDSPPQPKAKSEKDSEKATVPFEDASPKTTRQAGGVDPIKDTAVLSRDNPLLRRALNKADDDDAFQGTSTLGEKREVILLIRGMAERVVMQEGVIYKLGRFELGMSAPNEVDLTPYGAMDRGVSRVHAQLHLQDDRLYITDLSSTNGTYVSGNRIEPDTPTPLRKGDELLLGRLQVQILFR